MQLSTFLTQDEVNALQGKLPAYAGMCFDEPEEGDMIEIGGEPFEFMAMTFEDEKGSLWERFGWYHWAWFEGVPSIEPLS